MVRRVLVARQAGQMQRKATGQLQSDVLQALAAVPEKSFKRLEHLTLNLQQGEVNKPAQSHAWCCPSKRRRRVELDRADPSLCPRCCRAETITCKRLESSRLTQ